MDTELEDGHCNLKVGLELAIDCGVRVQSASLSEHHDFFANLPPVQCQPDSDRDSECQSPSQLPALGREVNEHSDASHVTRSSTSMPEPGRAPLRYGPEPG